MNYWWHSFTDLKRTALLAVFEPTFYLVSPDKRLYYIYLLSAAVLALFTLIFFQSPKKSLIQNFKGIFAKRIWFHKSSIMDLKLIFLNSILKSFLIFPWAITATTMALAVHKLLIFLFTEAPNLNISSLYVAILFTLASFIISDFIRFYFHYLLHRIPFLWELHKVHHSATVMTPLTVHRAHPIENLLAVFRNSFSTGLTSGIFIFLFSNQLSGIDIIGVNALAFIFNIVGSNLRHSHIRLSFGPLEYIFLSPAQHQIHHGLSPKQHHKNMGVGLSIWDQIWGTFHTEKKYKKIEFGLNEKILNHKINLSSVIIDPLKVAINKTIIKRT